MQQPWVQNAVPLATSLVLHVALLVGGYIGIKTVQKAAQVIKDQIIIPDAAIVDGAPVGGIPNPGIGGDPTRSAAQDQVQDTPSESQGFSAKPSQSLEATLAGGATGENNATDGLIGVGANGGGSGKGTGLSNGNGIGAGTGEGSGALAPFGPPGGGGGIGPKSPFMGISGNGRKVIYLCDASGSMLTVFDSLRTQLNQSVSGLRTIQSFNIIFFKDEDVFALSKGELLMANPSNKEKAYDFVKNTNPGGGTNPTASISLAFKQKPDLVYVLTDGFDNVASLEDVVSEFNKDNTDKHAHVSTILLKSREDPQLVETLKKIADQNGGTFKSIDKSDF